MSGLETLVGPVLLSDPEEIDDETGKDEPEYYNLPKWLRQAFEELQEQLGEDR
jgi:hypothetical protein